MSWRKVLGVVWLTLCIGGLLALLVAIGGWGAAVGSLLGALLGTMIVFVFIWLIEGDQ